jgi:glycosyltransferase involved in cell wall biosynthesis
MCLERGNDSGLPNNVEVHTLGRENGKNRLIETAKFNVLATWLVPKVDGVFAHQNPEYGILIAPWAKLFRKKVVAWYTHGKVSARLRLLNALADKLLTASAESFRLPSSKLKVLHHGIDTDLFAFKHRKQHPEVRLLSISRISATKRILEMIEMVADLKKRTKKKVYLKIVGEPALAKDQEYSLRLKSRISELRLEEDIEFLGSLPNNQTPKLYQEADIFLNFSQTGSLDKAGLEAMSCGCLLVASNEAFEHILGPIDELLYEKDLGKLADNIVKLAQRDNNPLRQAMRRYVVDNHNLTHLAQKIVEQF